MKWYARAVDDVQDIKKITIDIERDLLEEVIENLKKNRIDQPKAQMLAKEFLSHLPPKDFNAMMETLKQMSSQYQEARDVYIKYLAMQEEANDQNKINQMSHHISGGNIEKAIEIAKGGVNAA